MRTDDGRAMRYVGVRQIVIDGEPTPVPYWEPPQLFAGQTVAIVGGGPSHADIDLDLLRGHRFIAINSACRKVRPIATADDWLYFHDNSWAENRADLVRDWPGRVVSPNRSVKARLKGDADRINFDWVAEHMAAPNDAVGGSSGHAAACAAAVLGAKRIILIGFECRHVNGRTHGHDDYGDQSGDIYAAFRDNFLPGWRALAPAFKRMGVQIINATPQSAVAEFPFMPLRDALQPDGMIRGPVVASFFAPRYDKWGCDYDKLLHLLDASCRRLALRHMVISDKPRPGLETALFDLPDNLMMALLDGQRQFLECVEGPVLFVGADSLITRDPFAIAPDCQLALTFGPFTDCPMNNGFMLCRDIAACAVAWADAIALGPKNWGDDQRCQLAAFEASGLRIARLRCEDQNWAPENVTDACKPTVVHFRGHRKDWMPQWAQRHMGIAA